MTPAPLRHLLETRLGFDLAALGERAVAAAVAAEQGDADPADFARRLAAEPGRLERLVNRLVIAETWFYRGAGLFPFLAATLAGRVRAGRSPAVLSVPCSTGEEPYSLAIALAEAGVPTGAVALDAADIAPPALELARAGVYRGMAFRDFPAELRDRHFRPAPGGAWVLDPELRRRVSFRAGNLLDADFFADRPGAYDVIFCRNLLIYFGADGRRRALAALGRLLAPGGLLAVGHAEGAVAAGGGFRASGPEGLFVFERADAATPAALPMPARRIRAPEPVESPGTIVPGLSGDAPQPPLAPPDRWLAARALADAGRLAEALAACENELTAGSDAAGFALQGVVLQALGRSADAAEAFRRALYLDPNHPEALAHARLAALALGDRPRADAFAARLAKLDGGVS